MQLWWSSEGRGMGCREGGTITARNRAEKEKASRGGRKQHEKGENRRGMGRRVGKRQEVRDCQRERKAKTGCEMQETGTRSRRRGGEQRGTGARSRRRGGREAGQGRRGTGFGRRRRWESRGARTARNWGLRDVATCRGTLGAGGSEKGRKQAANAQKSPQPEPPCPLRTLYVRGGVPGQPGPTKPYVCPGTP